jgi:hypothetical protein
MMNQNATNAAQPTANAARAQIMDKIIDSVAELDKASDLQTKIKARRELNALLRMSLTEGEQELTTLKDQDKAEARYKVAEYAKQMGYSLDDLMPEHSLGAAGDSSQEDRKQPAEPPVKTGRNAEPKAPYDYLLKEEFMANGQTDFTAGYYSHAGIRPQTGWVKEFVTAHGRKPTKDDCRAATEQEKGAMRAANEAEFASIKRRGPHAKKA